MVKDVFDLADGIEYLRTSGKKVLLYGMGNGAEKAHALLTSKGIEVSGVFASDGFVRGHSFMGYPVLSMPAAEELYGDFIAVLSFGLEGRKADILQNVAARHHLYVPYMAVCGEGVTDKRLITEHREEIEKVYSLLADERSKRLYKNAISYCITGDISYLTHTEGDDIPPVGYFTSSGTYIDVGAYNGDTAEEYYRAAPDIKDIICFEPDRRSHKKMLERNIPCLTAFNAAAGRCDGETLFSGGGGRNSSTGKGNTVIPVKSIDSAVGNMQVGCIKIDAEGDEREVLAGAKETLWKNRPSLNVSLYHRAGDLWELPLLLHRIDGKYKLYIRKKEYVPMWDISVYCMP